MNALARKIPEALSPLQFEIIDDSQSFAALKAKWDALALRGSFPTPFQLFGYSHACWKAYSDTLDLRLVIGTALGEIRCIAPFAQPKNQPGFWTPLGEAGADYLDLLVAREDASAQEHFRRWMYENRLWQKAQWHDLPERSSLLEFSSVRALTQQGIWLRAQQALQQHFPLTLTEGAGEHCFMTADDLKEKRDVLSHRSHTKHANWLGRQGKLEYRSLRDPVDLRRALPALMAMHQRKWSARNEASFYNDPKVVRFSELLLEELAEHQCLRMDLLTLSGRPIAAHLGFQFQGRLYWYITAYEPEYHAHSPGKLLLGHVIARAPSDGINEIDFLRGDESYKSHYGTGRRPVLGIRQYRTRTAYLADAVKRHFFTR